MHLKNFFIDGFIPLCSFRNKIQLLLIVTYFMDSTPTLLFTLIRVNLKYNNSPVSLKFVISL